MFLVEGPAGCRKSKLVKTAAESFGLHLMEADFAEVQSLTSAQTEAKLRIILNDAERCIPCVLLLQNIQVMKVKEDRKIVTSNIFDCHFFLMKIFFSPHLLLCRYLALILKDKKMTEFCHLLAVK